MQSTTSREVYKRRKKYNEFIKGSDYEAGIKYWIDQWNSLENADLTDLANAEIWGFRQRLRFIWGDIKSIRTDLTYLQDELKNNCPEIFIAQGFVAYDESRFFDAYDFFQKAAELHVKRIKGFSSYFLMRVHLLSAKCCWRWDDLPKALCHLGMSAYHVMAYHSEQPADVKYVDYYHGRIFSIYPRLLTPRRGPDTDGAKNVEITDRYLSKAKAFFKTTCLFKRKDGSTVPHLVEAEILELQAQSLRNQALRTPRDKDSDKFFNDAENLLKDVSNILDYEFGGKVNRRKSHVLRRRGMLKISRILRHGRKFNFHLERHDDANEAFVLFSKEIKEREKIFGNKQHSTISRAYNNRALAGILAGNAYYYYNLKNLEKAIEAWEAAKKDAKKAIEINTGCSLKDIHKTDFNCISDAQLLTSLNHLMDVSYLIPHAKGIFDYNTLITLKKYYDLAKRVESNYLNKLSSVISHEDIGRRTHPIYESMLEPCWQLLNDTYSDSITANNRIELNNLVADIFSRAVSPHLYQVIRRSETKGELKTLEVPYPEDGVALRILDNLFNGNEENNVKEEEVLSLKDYLQWNNTYTGNPADFTVDIQLMSERFTIKPGGAMVHFIGTRFSYVLMFGGHGTLDSAIYPQTLIKLNKDQPFLGVYNLKKLIEHVDKAGSELIEHDEKKKGGLVNIKPEDGVWKANLIFKSGLHKLYETLVEPCISEFADCNRFYIVSDKWEWKIPWPALMKQAPKEVQTQNPSEYWITDTLISQQASIGTIMLLPETYNQGVPIQDQLMVTGFHSEDSQDTHDKELKIGRFVKAFYDLHPIPALNNGERANGHKAIDPEIHKIKEVSKMMQEADVIILLGHSGEASNHKYHLGFLFSKHEGGNPVQECELRQTDILKLDLSAVKMVLLLTCRGGDGHLRTGNVPRSFFNAFLAARAKNVIYSSKLLNEKIATNFTEKLLANLRKMTFGEAYQAAIIETIKKNESHPIQWGVIHFIGDQMGRLY